MAQLPQEFLTRMQDMLGDEFDAFLTSYDAPRTAGLRVNTKKCRTEDFPPLVPGTWKKIPWIPNGYFVPDGMRVEHAGSDDDPEFNNRHLALRWPG